MHKNEMKDLITTLSTNWISFLGVFPSWLLDKVLVTIGFFEFDNWMKQSSSWECNHGSIGDKLLRGFH